MLPVFDFVSKVFPDFCHICSNDCDCLVIKPKANPKKKKAPAKTEDDNFEGKSKMASSAILKDELLNDLFVTVADEEDAECMTMEGIAKMCGELEIDAAVDVRALVLCWKFGCTTPGCITKEEFCNGMKHLGVTSWSELKCITTSGILDLGSLETFKEFFKFAFQFSCEGTYKTIEKDTILLLLPMVLDVKRAPHLTLFVDFLAVSAAERITLDQWDSFLRFNELVDLDLGNFDDNGAWPLLLDEYVKWRHSTKA